MSKKYISPELTVVLFETKDALMAGAGGYEKSYVDPFQDKAPSPPAAEGKIKQDWSPIDSLK